VSWQLGSTAVVLAVLAAAFGWYERRRPSSKMVAVVAALAAAAVAGRVVLTPLPNVQATTDIALLSGYVLGAGPGFAVGATAALASNFFLGQGPWTPWEMLGWGGAGVAGAVLAAARVPPRRVPLALACALAGFAFGAWMDLFTLLVFAAEHSGDTYLAISASSLPFNVAHAVGNALLAVVLGPGFVRLLDRYRRRFEISWRPAPATATAAALALAIAFSPALLAAPARAADGARAALRYLERAQNGDGGFGAARGQPSSQLLTGWTAIGLEAGGRNPLDVRRGGRSAIDYMRAQAASLEDAGELERTIIALRGAGLDPRRLGARDLVAELLAQRRSNGSFGGQVNWTAFGVLALRAAGRSAHAPPVRSGARFIARSQNRDGGFSFAASGGSDVDDTGAALQALAAAGRRGSRASGRALAYLRRRQNADGGFGQLAHSRSNAQSTAWAIQGLVAAGRDPDRFQVKGGRSALAYLRSLQEGNGNFRYSRTSSQTPVWVTAQALAAVRRKPLPLAPVKRVRKAREPARRSVRPAPARARSHRAGASRARKVVPADKPKQLAVRAVGGVASAPAEPTEDRSSLPSLLAIGAGAAACAAAGLLGFRRRRH
jgi:energy-coupling factor transport system substrate-specific component